MDEVGASGLLELGGVAVRCCGRYMSTVYTAVRFTPATHQLISRDNDRVCSACGNTLTIRLKAKDHDD